MAPFDAIDCDKYGDDLLAILRGSTIGIVGGGAFCLKLLEFFLKHDIAPKKPNITAVADIQPDAPGILYAKERGIITTPDFMSLYQLDSIEVILEITHDPNLAAIIRRTKPAHMQLIDHFQARCLWDLIQVENIKLQTLKSFQEVKTNPKAVEKLLHQCFECFNSIMGHRNERSRQIELELGENQKTQEQIIQGSTIPTFVINQDHIVTHWNHALEKMSGWPAGEVLGTNRQWAPFWDRERPTMADVILDQIDEQEIHKLYGSQWRKSALIEGAYEAEIFFPQVGKVGKWLWFTAAPLKAPDGTIIGAIETLWDKTEDKKAEEERDRHTRELAALCSIYTALSAPWLIDHRIEAALKEIQLFLKADDICIYLRGNEEGYYLKYHYGQPLASATANKPVLDKSLVHAIANAGDLILIEKLAEETHPDYIRLASRGFSSVALIPISAKEKRTVGVLQIASRGPKRFAPGTRHLLDLIGNRIGVAIENATLQEQYIKSEEKYRSLFNNDPNPIFIIDQQTLIILDTNERAQECYGYSRKALAAKSFLQLGDPEDHEVATGLRQLEFGQSILFSKKRHYRNNERPFYVNINASQAHYGENDVLIATTTDITETVEKETQLIQASKMTTLGLMAAGMAHEINQPLNVIQICADYFLKMLDKGMPIANEDLRIMANDITDNVERATGIIRHVRDFARQAEVVRTRMDVNAPIKDVFKVLGHQIKAHQIELDLDLATGLPCILADHNRLEQVFINLVTNAIDAIDEKANLPRYKGMRKQLLIKSRPKQNKVVVTVKDNGIGMSEEVKLKIFEPFFTTKKIGKGTGLGVSISYGIVKDYDGAIRIDSKIEHGTTFTMTFPALNHES